MERATPEIYRIITLSSGASRGSNLLALHHYFAEAALPIQVHCAIFSKDEAPAISACLELGIPHRIIPARKMQLFEQQVLELIASEDIQLIALCGFMRLLSASFIQLCGIPILNVHPALLPNYGGCGMHGRLVHEAVFAAGEQRSGATIHLVDPIYDHGRIVAQASVDISTCLDASEIATQVLGIEHHLYPRAIARYLLQAKPRIAISTLGCKTNFFESASIFEQFEDFELVDSESPAEIYIINSCTVTNRADYKSRYLIRKALAKKLEYPLAKVVVTGCFAQRSREEIQALGDVDFIVDNQNKLNIAEILAGQSYQWQDIMQATDFAYRPVSNMLGHTRAFQKIQDGCDFYCAYCAVPYGRGHSRSAHFADVVAQAKLFAEAGFKEIVLGGVNLGLYRDGDIDLVDVVNALSGIEGLSLIRISSIEPQLLHTEMLKRLQDIPKLCPHFHIPIQSASDTVLQRMGRHYDSTLIRKLSEDILIAFPDAAIGFDVITGFPGESETTFTEGYELLQELPIAYLHVFSYSRRKGTVADSMPNQVPNREKTRRAGILSALSQAKKLLYRDLLLRENTRLSGVVEMHSEILSDHYLRVKLPFEELPGAYAAAGAREVDFVL